jgi:hypothetical protein
MTFNLAAIVDSLSDRVVPPVLRRDLDVFRLAKRVAVFDVAFIFWTVLFAAVYVGLGSTRCGLLTLLAVPPILASLFVLERGQSPTFCGNLLCLGGWLALTSLGFVNGGSTAPPLLWFTCLPAVAVLTAGPVWGFVWTMIPVATIGGFALAEVNGTQFSNELAPDALHVFLVAALAALVVCQFVLVAVRVGIEDRAQRALREASRQLLQVRKDMATLKAAFGFSLEDWTKLQREKTALEQLLKYKLEGADPDDADLEDDDLDDADFGEARASDSGSHSR